MNINAFVDKLNSCCCLCAAVLLQMSVTEDLPEMDGADLLGLLLHGGEDGSTEPLFPDGNGLIESWLSEQEVRDHSQKININSGHSWLDFFQRKSFNCTVPLCVWMTQNATAVYFQTLCNLGIKALA